VKQSLVQNCAKHNKEDIKSKSTAAAQLQGWLENLNEIAQGRKPAVKA